MLIKGERIFSNGEAFFDIKKEKGVGETSGHGKHPKMVFIQPIPSPIRKIPLFTPWKQGYRTKLEDLCPSPEHRILKLFRKTNNRDSREKGLVWP